ncbi:MAG: phosphatidate cytidylyltransferase [Deltaproteobacteria bacterium]|nr:phosphatidate cytidylyltransferase [Deltaproteobacteria bacterium]
MRILSALIALPFVLYLIYLGGWPFAALVLVVSVISLLEITGMTLGDDPVARGVVVVLGAGLVSATSLGVLSTDKGLALTCLGLVALLVVFLFRIGEITTVAQRMGSAVLALGWGGLLVASIGALRALPEGGAWVLLACVLAWGTDTGAYFTGRLLGRHKLYERVSPKKTWEGAVGGLVIGVLLAFVFQRFFGPSALEPAHLALLAPVGSALGQLGDLAESLLKRSVGVKDSGRIMPGHGGILDRIDALVFVAPTLLAYGIWVLGLSPSWL